MASNYISQLPEELQDVANGIKDILNVKVITPDTYVKVHPNGLPPKWKRKAFILNIIDGPKFTKREGAQIDTIHLTALFTELDFEITTVPSSETDLNNIETNLEVFIQRCKDDKVDCFIIFIGSHGADKIIKTSDGKYLDVYQDIIYPCQFAVYEDGKPVEKRVVRIFINQSCQNDPPLGLSGRPPPQDVVMKDSIYVAAQIPKFKASRDRFFGSYYVLVLTYVFKTKAWNTHLVDLFLEVQELLPKVAKCADEVQFPPIMLGLRQPFYFFKNPHDFQFGVSHPVNLFTGRKAELMNLHTKFQQQNSLNLDSKKVAIVGLGGIGKSELARVYCQHFVGAVIWLNAETEETLTDSFCKVATSHLEIPSEDDITKSVSKVFKCFIGKPSLFVFDNVEDVEIFEKFAIFPEPNSTPPFILITSQINLWSFKDEEVLELFEMTETDAFELVKKGLNPTEEINDKILLQLITTLQFLPLALSQATSCINRENRLQPNAIGHYLELHRSSSKIPFTSGTTLGFHRHTKTIYTTFRLTLDKISEQTHGNRAIDVLKILSYFQPDKIPTKLLLEYHKDALQLLLDFSVVNAESQNYSIRIHRLVQAFVRLDVRESQMEDTSLRNGLILLSQHASEDAAVHLFSVLKYCNNMKDLKDAVDNALSINFENPKIITSLLNRPNGRKCITIEKCGSNENDWKVMLDLSIIIGIGSNARQVQETYILSHVLQTNEKARSEIIVHPAVQGFVDLKWSKMKYPIYFSTALSTIWLILTGITFTTSFKAKLGFQTDDDDEVYNFENSSCFSWLLVFTHIRIVTETIEMLLATKAPSYWRQLEKACEWILTIEIYRLVYPTGFQLPVQIDYNVSLVTLVIAFVLIFGQVLKHGDLMRQCAEALKLLIPRQVMFGAGFILVLATFFWSIEEYVGKTPSELCYNIEKWILPQNSTSNFTTEMDNDCHDVCLKGVGFVLITVLAAAHHFIVASSLPGFMLEKMFMMETLTKKSTALLPYAPLIEESYMVTKNRTIMLFWPLCYILKSTKEMQAGKLENDQFFNAEEPYVVTKRMSDFSSRVQKLLKKFSKMEVPQNEIHN